MHDALYLPRHGIYHGTAPSYVLELCKCCTDSRLRSAAHGDFTIPRTCLHFADRSFAVAGPKAWNALPSRLYSFTRKDTFRKHLKTHFLTIVLISYWQYCLCVLSCYSCTAPLSIIKWRLTNFIDWLIDWLISADVQRITSNASSCMTISCERNERLDIIAGFLSRRWLYEWFSQFHSCGTYSVLSWSASLLMLFAVTYLHCSHIVVTVIDYVLIFLVTILNLSC